MGFLRLALDAVIVGSAALAIAGLAEKLVGDGITIAGVGVAPFAGAAVGAGLAMALIP